MAVCLLERAPSDSVSVESAHKFVCLLCASYNTAPDEGEILSCYI